MVVRLLGRPDAIVRPGDELWGLVAIDLTAQSPIDQALVYQWRGWHDFQFYAIRDRRVVQVGWWMAGE